ncbi:MAG: hypothetical protein M1836_001125 [Candelina mexicana]|nr:MAG: hypothetical protein M1836_001125 [Candelina mexicana]
MSYGLGTMLETGKYSDLTLRCHGEDFRVHRAVVCAASKVIGAAIDGGFKEAGTSVYVLRDEDPGTLRRALAFLYNKDYHVISDGKGCDTESAIAQEVQQSSGNTDPKVDESHATDPGPPLDAPSQTATQDTGHTLNSRPDLFAHVKVYAFGDKYDISGLKNLAAAKFKECFIGLNSSFIEDFHTLVQDVYQSTPPSDRGLRTTIIECCGQNLDSLLAIPSFQELLRNIDGFALDLLQEVVQQLDELQKRLSRNTQELQSEAASLELEKDQITNSYTAANRDYHNLDARLDEAIARARRIKCCRHCGKDFGSSFDRGSGMPNSKIILRCDNCACKHY